MEKVFLIIGFLLHFIPANANHQFLHDKLIWNGDTTNIEIYPLEMYISNIKKIKIDSIFGPDFFDPKCWNCFKNYVAEWEIMDNQLYLLNIYSWNYKNDHLKANLLELFPDRYKNGKVNANWFTGAIYVPKGDYISMDYGDYHVYKSEWTINFKYGKLIDKHFRGQNYYISVLTKKEDSLGKFIEYHLNWRNIPELKKTESASFSIKTGKDKRDFTVTVRTDNEFIKNELLRISKQIHEFSYYYWHGKPLSPTYTQRLSFSEALRPKEKKIYTKKISK